jgi:hypothetical protein
MALMVKDRTFQGPDRKTFRLAADHGAVSAGNRLSERGRSFLVGLSIRHCGVGTICSRELRRNKFRRHKEN